MRSHFIFLLSLILGILSSTPKAYSQDDGLDTLRIMTYNIQHGAGSDDVVNMDRQAAVIGAAQPDIVGLQEVDSCVKRSGYINEAAVLASKLGMHATFGPAIPLTKGKYGVAILSKEEPLSVRNIPLPGSEKRTLLVCEFQEYVFACTHLALEEENRLTSLDIILEEVARWEKPFFICGDWNDEPSSKLITTMKRKFRFLNNLTASPANYTFPASSPKKIIDYIATYGHVIKSIRSRQVINEPNASDHRPVLVVITIKPYTTGIQSPSADLEAVQDEEIYDLSGKRVATGKSSSRTLPKGLYIMKNAKKVIAVK